MTETIEELESMVKNFEYALTVAKGRLHDARVAACGVIIGDIVIDTKGKRHRVSNIDPTWSKPWLKGNPERADGTFGAAERNIFGDWTKELQGLIP